MVKLGVLQKFGTTVLVVILALVLLPFVTAAEEPPKKTIELKISNVKFEEVGHYGQFIYTREFHDHGGSGAKIRHGQVCYSSGGCISAPLEYLVEPDGVLKQESELLMPMSISQASGFTYIGEDVTGAKIIAKARILVIGDHLELQELE